MKARSAVSPALRAPINEGTRIHTRTTQRRARPASTRTAENVSRPGTPLTRALPTQANASYGNVFQNDVQLERSGGSSHIE